MLLHSYIQLIQFHLMLLLGVVEKTDIIHKQTDRYVINPLGEIKVFSAVLVTKTQARLNA